MQNHFKKSRNTIILTTLITIAVVLWQDWSIRDLIVLYWFEGIFLALFSSIILARFENKYLALIILSSQIFMFTLIWFLLIKDQQIWSSSLNWNSLWILIGILFLQELFIFIQEFLKPKNKFNNLLKDQWNQIIGRPLFNLMILGAFFTFGIIFLFLNQVATIIFICIKGYLDQYFFRMIHPDKQLK